MSTLARVIVDMVKSLWNTLESYILQWGKALTDREICENSELVSV